MTQTIRANPEVSAGVARPRRTWRTFLGIALVVLAAVVIGILLSKCAASSGGPQAAFLRSARPTITVGVAKATLADVPITVTALGTVTPEVTVSVVPRVTGQITSVLFKEGQMVRKGDLLVQIDPSPFQAALKQAEGTLAHDRASLAGAQRDLSRYQTLVQQNSIARQTAEDQAATVRQAAAQALSDQGAVDTAKLNLQWTRIVSPINGRVGIRQVDPGNQVTANGTTPIAVVTQIDPIDVIFAVPEDAIPSIVRHKDFGAGLAVTAYDRSGGAALATGSLTTIDNVIDTTTGTVKGKARFANPQSVLFPNQFVNVTLLVDTLKGQVIVPTTAIRHGPNGDFVWVLQPDKTVKSRSVKTGPGTGETTSIASGLAAGETVITEGGDRLRDGATVSLPRSRSGGTGAGGAGYAAYGGFGG
jgi:multidrug efflux system membrane fusion protein